LPEQADEVRIGALVKDEKASVDPVGDAIERHVDRVGVTAEMTAGLEQGDLRQIAQPIRHGKPRDSGAHHRNAPHGSGAWALGAHWDAT